ncbi:uncharacterized protein LOC127149523 [Cucumis melo]|uniref:Uncharacterized protein LOC127149523 n=1 Tax=Cucumis melo TaxID=3656 RepID=A0ABM3KTX3_CUCME|nr:uncharacterized protein LOC127149523 [Cucumis melo]
MEDWSPNQVSLNGKLFSIESEMFSNILTTFSVYNEVDTILITSKGSQITFSAVPCEEIIIREESGDCLIIGDREVETHMHMPLHPSSFFINCGLQARRVWFLETTDSCAIIHFPFQVYAHFLMICFPFANVNSAQD